VTPVVWQLVTNREAHDLDAVIELIDWYRARWEIEMFFHVLKNACKVEALQLSHVDRVERALVLYRVVSWRIARLMRLGRTCPELDASLFFDADEIRGAYLLSKIASPPKPPTLNQVIRLIASLGKSDGEPGAKTLWIGLQRTMMLPLRLRLSATRAHDFCITRCIKSVTTSAIKLLDMVAVHAQVQLSGQQAFDTEDVQGALLYKLHALAREVTQRALLRRIDVAFR
jgi:hypothetical protein